MTFENPQNKLKILQTWVKQTKAWKIKRIKSNEHFLQVSRKFENPAGKSKGSRHEYRFYTDSTEYFSDRGLIFLYYSWMYKLPENNKFLHEINLIISFKLIIMFNPWIYTSQHVTGFRLQYYYASVFAINKTHTLAYLL